MTITVLFNLLDHSTGKIIRQIPVSCLPSDIAMRSKISKLAVDNQGKELYITDVGCMFVIKLGLLDSSCFQFGWDMNILLVFFFNQVSRWKGRLSSPADLVWAVPSYRGVLVCIDLKGETSILMFSKDGTFLKKKVINFSICDAGIDQFLIQWNKEGFYFNTNLTPN